MKKEIKLIENKNRKIPTYNVYVNGESSYTAFKDETKAKAAAFDEACKEVIDGNKITVSYLSF